MPTEVQLKQFIGDVFIHASEIPRDGVARHVEQYVIRDVQLDGNLLKVEFSARFVRDIREKICDQSSNEGSPDRPVVAPDWDERFHEESSAELSLGAREFDLAKFDLSLEGNTPSGTISFVGKDRKEMMAFRKTLREAKYY